MNWSAYLAVMGATALKFIGGPLTGLALGLTWYETALCTWLGMMLTVSVVLGLGHRLQTWYFKYKKPKGLVVSKRLRTAVKIWKMFGIQGIAFMTPLLFTPIGGSLLALSFRAPLLRIWTFMAIYGAIWALALSSLVLVFRINFPY